MACVARVRQSREYHIPYTIYLYRCVIYWIFFSLRATFFFFSKYNIGHNKEFVVEYIYIRIICRRNSFINRQENARAMNNFPLLNNIHVYTYNGISCSIISTRSRYFRKRIWFPKLDLSPEIDSEIHACIPYA